ncbi:unnamed protein product [Malus baccata var. baccata]
MVELENLLLEATGRTCSSGKNRHSYSSSRRRCRGSYSDGGSDSRGDDCDDGRGYASRKPSGPQGSQEEYGYNDSGSDREGGDNNESDVGSDLYKDEDHRRKLAEMSELQRELILYEIAQKKDDKSLKEKFRPKWDKGKAPQSRKETQPLPSPRVRSSARSADRAAFKDDALNELRAKRLKQQDAEAHRKLRDASRSQDDGSSGDDAMIDSDDERSEGLTFDDINEITIQRLKLAKWFMEPFLEKLIVVCVVRVRIGRSKFGTVNGGSSLEAAAGAGMLIDMNAFVDFGTESNLKHNFELPISLAALQKFGKPHGDQKGFLARKQRIEAIVGCQVAENDGRRKR